MRVRIGDAATAIACANAVPPARIETLLAKPPRGSSRSKSLEIDCFIKVPALHKSTRVDKPLAPAPSAECFVLCNNLVTGSCQAPVSKVSAWGIVSFSKSAAEHWFSKPYRLIFIFYAEATFPDIFPRCVCRNPEPQLLSASTGNVPGCRFLSDLA